MCLLVECVGVADLCNFVENHAALRLTGYLGNFTPKLVSGLTGIVLFCPRTTQYIRLLKERIILLRIEKFEIHFPNVFTRS